MHFGAVQKVWKEQIGPYRRTAGDRLTVKCQHENVDKAAQKDVIISSTLSAGTANSKVEKNCRLNKNKYNVAQLNCAKIFNKRTQPSDVSYLKIIIEFYRFSHQEKEHKVFQTDKIRNWTTARTKMSTTFLTSNIQCNRNKQLIPTSTKLITSKQELKRI